MREEEVEVLLVEDNPSDQELTLRALRQEFASGDGPKRFAVLGHFLPGSLETPTYDEAAAQLGLSLPALKSELHRLRHRFPNLHRRQSRHPRRSYPRSHRHPCRPMWDRYG